MIASEKDELEQTVNRHLTNGAVAPILSFDGGNFEQAGKRSVNQASSPLTTMRNESHSILVSRARPAIDRGIAKRRVARTGQH
jgi:hypothetical protein